MPDTLLPRRKPVNHCPGCGMPLPDETRYKQPLGYGGQDQAQENLFWGYDIWCPSCDWTGDASGDEILDDDDSTWPTGPIRWQPGTRED